MCSKPIVIIGAGIVGVSTAIWLQRSGHEAILIDKGMPGQEASYGNSGLLAGWAIAPITSPSLWMEAPRMLFNPRKPLFIKWAHLPGLVPWLAKLMMNATDEKTKQIVSNLTPLLTDTVDQHRALVRGTSLESWIHDSKLTYVYRNVSAFNSDKYTWDIKAAAGMHPTVLTGAAVQEEEPILGSNMGCIAQLSGFGHITDPGNYVAKLADEFVKLGGKLVNAMVTDFTTTNGKVTTVMTSEGDFTCDRAVITSGIWSKDLMRKLGLSIPMQTERGYHVIYENPSHVPRNPMMMSEGKFGVNAMDMGLRFSGTVELGNHHSGPSKAPLRLIEHHVRRAFPDLTCTGTKEWMGFRPTLPDSTPMIGEIGQTGIYAGFGHQHVGLTAGPKSGRILSQMISGTPPNIDMTPYTPDRFTL